MSNPAFFNFVALASLVPAALVSLRRDQQGKDGLFFAVLGVAIAGPLIWAAVQLSDQWRTGLSTTLWVIIAGSLVLFGLLVATVRQAWRLTPLLLPYLMLLGVLAALFDQVQGRSLAPEAPLAWREAHILVAVATFGFFTMAAVAALAGFLQERALKTKRPTSLTRALPSVADSETLANRLLAASELVLGIGLVTGMTTLYLETGSMLVFSHKIVLSILVFVMIGALLIGHQVCGVRGRWAARLVMVAYLLLMLALPGVKFVRDVLLS